MDLSALGSLLTSLKTATDLAKFIRESDVSIERAELRLKLAELVEALANAKLEASDVQQAILDRDQLIRELRLAASIRDNLKWRQPCYYLTNDDGVEEPFCQICYDSSARLSRLHTDGRGRFSCRVCKQVFHTLERSESDAQKADAAMRSMGTRRLGW